MSQGGAVKARFPPSTMNDNTAIIGFLSLLVTGVIANLFHRLARLEKRVDGLQTSLGIWKLAYVELRTNVSSFVAACRRNSPTQAQLNALDSAKTITQLEADVIEAIQSPRRRSSDALQ